LGLAIVLKADLGSEFTVFSAQGTNAPLLAFNGLIFDGNQYAMAATFGTFKGGFGGVYGAIIPAIIASLPQLSIAHSGTNVILTWPTNGISYTLQSATNLVSPSVWGNVSPSSVIVNGKNTVTNGILSQEMFYRLSQ